MKIYFLIILSGFNLCYSQEKIEGENLENIESKTSFEENILLPLEKNQLYFEKVFLHLNKSSYFIDDIIWFKAYVGDSKNNPSNKTSRLHVNLLDAQGKIIEHQNIFIYKGTGKGQIILNDSLKTGTYYLQAFTNYMKNFKEGNCFFQEINILNKVISKENTFKKKYDIQLFPEGGFFLEDVENVVAVKALLNGIGCSYTGKILNQKKKEIAAFKSEHLGMTKCKFLYKQDEKYTAVIKTNDTLFTIALPDPEKIGLIFSVDNSKPTVIDLDIKTNKNSLSQLKKNSYKLLFHQRNQIIDYFEIQELHALNFNVQLERKNFFEGVNTITLFKDNKPIAERKFFNKNNKDLNIIVEKSAVVNDSTAYKIKLDKIVRASLSTAILPLNSFTFSQSQSIKSAFLLSPYVKGFIENPDYYFKNENATKNNDLDLLLLTQGWTQYTAEEMIDSLNPSYKYDFEAGIKITGKVYPLPSNQLALMTQDNVIIDKIFLNGKKDFSFNNLLLYNNEVVKLSFIDGKNQAIKPENLEVDTEKSKPDFFKFEFKTEDKTILNHDLWNDFYQSTAIQLQEVNVTVKNKKYIAEKKIIQKYKPIVYDIGRYSNLEIAPQFKNKDLMHFLNFDQDVRLVNWNGTENYLETGIRKEAVLNIDGRLIDSGELSSGVSLKMEDVEHILVQSIRGNKIFQVFTTENYRKDIIELFKEYVVKDGFNKKKKYYTPMYSFDSTAFTNWTEIDWKPNLEIENAAEISFNILSNNNLKEYLFAIQGFTSDGDLISETIKFENK